MRAIATCMLERINGMLLTTCVCALALGAAAPRMSAAPSHVIELRGTRIEGGVPGTFREIVDLDTGYNTMFVQTGASTESSGFDGAPWRWTNGTVLRSTLPAAVHRAEIAAYVARLGWTRGLGEAGVHVHYAKSGRAETISIAADDGSETITLSDWRVVNGIAYPFMQRDVDPTGAQIILRIAQLRLMTPQKNAFAPPPAVNHGFIAGSQPVQVPFAFTGAHDPHILVNASINGHDAQLIFDTGGAHYFGDKAVQSWGLRLSGGTSIGGAGTGSLNAGFARVDSIRLGAAELRDQVAVVAPLPWPPGANSADGLTGSQFFITFRTTIDYQNKTLSFATFDTPNSARGTTVPFYTDDFHMYVTALVNGVPGVFGVDSGDAVAITLFRPFAERIGVASSAGTPDRVGGGVGGAFRLATVPLRTFSLAGATLANRNVKMASTTAGAFASKSIAGNLGGAFLRCFAVTIDFRARTLTFSNQANTPRCLAAIGVPAVRS